MKMISKELSIFKEDAEDTLRRSRTPKAFTRSVQNIVNGMGFSHFDMSHIEPSIEVVFSTIPVSLIDTYFAEGMDKYDLSNRYVAEANCPVFYLDLFRYFSNCPVNTVSEIKKTLLTYELLQDYGVYDSYCSVLSKNSNHKTIFSVYSEEVQSKEFRRQVLSSRAEIGILSNLIGNLLPQVDFIHDDDKKINKGLTEKQLSILEVMGKHSMTQQQAADYVGLTESTVKTYCKYIKQKLGQPTLMGAFYEAMKLGVIAID